MRWKPGKKTALWGALAVLAACVALALAWPREPTYNGRPLRYWIGLQVSGSFKERADASHALSQVGPEAVPALTRMLSLREGGVIRRLQRELSRWAPGIIKPPPNVVAIDLEAVSLLGRLGAAAAPAAPALLECFDAADPAEKQLLKNVWFSVDPAARGVLIAGGLRHPSLAVRIWVVESGGSGELMVDGVPVLPVLLELSQAKNVDARRAAAGRLTTLALLHHSTGAREAVLRLAQDPDPSIAGHILHSLGRLRPDAGIAAGTPGQPSTQGSPAYDRSASLAFLEALLKHPAALVRLHAAIKYWHLTRDASTALLVLIDALEEPSVTWEAAAGLREMGPAAEQAIPALIEAVIREPVHRPDRTPATSAMALAAIGPPALPGLLKLLDHENLDVRLSAANAIRVLGPVAADAVPGLLHLLEHDSAEAKTLACYTLGAIGPAAAAALPELEKLEASSRGYPQAAAAEAMERIRRELTPSATSTSPPSEPPAG